MTPAGMDTNHEQADAVLFETLNSKLAFLTHQNELLWNVIEKNGLESIAIDMGAIPLVSPFKSNSNVAEEIPSSTFTASKEMNSEEMENHVCTLEKEISQFALTIVQDKHLNNSPIQHTENPFSAASLKENNENNMKPPLPVKKHRYSSSLSSAHSSSRPSSLILSSSDSSSNSPMSTASSGSSRPTSALASNSISDIPVAINEGDNNFMYKNLNLKVLITSFSVDEDEKGHDTTSFKIHLIPKSSNQNDWFIKKTISDFVNLDFEVRFIKFLRSCD